MNLPKIIEAARKVSKKSDHLSCQMGSVIFDKQGRIYAASPNFHKKTHPVYNKLSPLKTLHSEAAAILSIRHKTDFSKLQILVYREYKDGEFHKKGDYALAKPCEFCQKMIKSFGIKTVWFTTENGIEKYEV